MQAEESLKEPRPGRTGGADGQRGCGPEGDQFFLQRKEQEESLGRDRGRVCSGKEGNSNA